MWWTKLLLLAVTTAMFTSRATTNFHFQLVHGLAASHNGRVVARGRASSSAATGIATTNKKVNVPTVAVIGGGIAGLSCAQHLTGNSNLQQFDVTVFDTGRLRPGGRCSSRNPRDPIKMAKEPINQERPVLSHHLYDHAAQILTVPSASDGSHNYTDFVKQVQQWVREGVVVPFAKDALYDLYHSSNPNRAFLRAEPILGNDDRNDDSSSMPLFYYGAMGMGSIPTAMVKQVQSQSTTTNNFELKQDVWVSPSNGVQYMPTIKKWRVQADGGRRVLGTYDYLVIAHNGKCADRLTSATPATALHQLLRVNFAPTVPIMHGGTRMTLNSIYSLTFALPKSFNLSQRLPPAFVAGFIHDHPALRFLTCQSRKYPKQEEQQEFSDHGDDAVEVWTVLSSATFAKKYKAPQEFLPDETIHNVTSMLLAALDEVLRAEFPASTPAGTATTPLSSSPPSPSLESRIVDRHLQLWGAAVPLNIWNVSPTAPLLPDVSNPSAAESSAALQQRGQRQQQQQRPAGFLYDASYQVGACGDWLLEASIAGAWTSGRLLAQHIQQHALSQTSKDTTTESPVSWSHGLQQGVFQRSEATAQVGIGAIATKTIATSMNKAATTSPRQTVTTKSGSGQGTKRKPQSRAVNRQMSS